jgi:formyl-CoA transferase
MFEEKGIPCGPIYNMAEMFADPQVKHLKMATPIQHPTIGEFEIVNQAIGLSRTPHQIRTATPEQGEHTDEILAELGYDTATIKAMHDKGAV